MFKPIQLVYGWYRNSLRNPKYRLWIVGGTLLWLVNPINAIPVVGEIDDAVVITIFATELSQVAIEGMKARRQQQAALLTAEVTQLTEKITQ